MATKVLLVDDESAIRRVVCLTLRSSGFEVVESARGEDALTLLGTTNFDVILLDLNMPGMGGVALCRIIRTRAPRTPVLMLTVRNSEDDKVESLDAGADDYVTKPFQVRELVARINAVIRRSQQPLPINSTITISDVSICSERRVFTKREQAVHLTRTQFDLVELLMRSPGKPVTHKTLLSTVWGREYRNHVEYLRTYMRQLRKIIEDDPSRPEYLLTVPYVGYRFKES